MNDLNSDSRGETRLPQNNARVKLGDFGRPEDGNLPGQGGKVSFPPAYQMRLLYLGERITKVVYFDEEGGLPVTLHYADWTGLKGYVVCNGSGCELCKIGPPTDRLLVPVFALAVRQVQPLLVSPYRGPKALLPQLQAEGIPAPCILKLSRPSLYDFEVQRVRGISPEEFATYSEIAAFIKAEAEGRIDLRTAIRKLSNEELVGIPEVKRELELLED